MAVFNVRRIEQTENCFKWLGIKFFQMFWSNRNCVIVDLRWKVIASCVFVVSILICNIFKTLHVSTISSFFLVKQYSSFNLRVKGETDRVFNILNLLDMQRMHPEWTFKNVMSHQRFPKKELDFSQSFLSKERLYLKHLPVINGDPWAWPNWYGTVKA